MDIPTWTLTLNGDEHHLVLRGLLAVIPGMVGGDGREFFQSVKASLQNGSGAITGHSVDLLSVADACTVYFDSEAANVRTNDASKDADAAYKVMDRVRKLILQKPTGKQAVMVKPVPAPVPVKAKGKKAPAAGAMNLFGDEG